MGTQPLKHRDQVRGQRVLCQDGRQSPNDRLPDEQANAELKQKSMELIDCLGPVPNQRFAYAMQSGERLLGRKRPMKDVE